MSEERDIKHPCLTVCILAQPDKYLELLRDSRLRDSGALARILPVLIPSRAGFREENSNEPGLEIHLLEPYYSAVREILDTPTSEQPHVAKLSPKAAECRREWFNSIEKELREFGEYSDVKDVASKIVTSTCKIALLIHLIQFPSLLIASDSAISLETFEKAKLIGQFHLNEAIKLIRHSRQNEKLKDHFELLRWLANKGLQSFAVSDAVQSGPHRMRDTGLIKKICDDLQKAGWLKVDETSKTKRFLVHPNLAELLFKNSSAGVA